MKTDPVAIEGRPLLLVTGRADSDAGDAVQEEDALAGALFLENLKAEPAQDAVLILGGARQVVHGEIDVIEAQAVDGIHGQATVGRAVIEADKKYKPRSGVTSEYGRYDKSASGN